MKRAIVAAVVTAVFVLACTGSSPPCTFPAGNYAVDQEPGAMNSACDVTGSKDTWVLASPESIVSVPPQALDFLGKPGCTTTVDLSACKTYTVCPSLVATMSFDVGAATATGGYNNTGYDPCGGWSVSIHPM